MRAFHAIAGLPRSGSTLLCNILAQNPAFYASSTSPLPRLLNGLSEWFSEQPEVKSDLHADPGELQRRLRTVMQATCGAWYAGRGGDVVFDKSREWTLHHELLWTLFPAAKLIVTVRDLKEVYASVLKQHSRNPLLRTVPGTALGRSERLFSPQGLIGGPLAGVMDLQRRRSPSAVFVQFEHLVQSPEEAMRALYEQLDEPYFVHDFERVENKATDLDALYLNKYPHEGAGKVSPPGVQWHHWMELPAAREIEQIFAGFYNAFYPQAVAPDKVALTMEK